MRTQDLQDDYQLKNGIIHLPSTINSPLAATIDSQIDYFRENEPNEPLRLYCRSDGGNATETLAIANLIRLDGNIEGHLIGESCSGGSVIWAACGKRFIYPYSRIGIHPCEWRMDNVALTAAMMYSKFRDFRGIDRAMCHIYAEASNQPFEWWWKLLNKQGDIKWLTAKQLVELEMGKMINTEPNM